MTARFTIVNDYPDTKIVEDFIDQVLLNHSDLKQEIRSARRGNSKTLVAHVKNTLQLVAITHDSSWHPNCTYVRLAYDFNRMTEDVLHQCVWFLQQEYSKPLFFLVDNRYHLLIKVLRTNQFSLIRETEILHICPLKSLTEISVLPNKRTFHEIKEDPEILASLIGLVKQVYTDTHLANPVANHSFTSWELAIMEGLMEENSYVIVQDSIVHAFSFLYGVNDESWELGWIGVRDMKNISELDKLIQVQLKDAVQHDIRFIEKEADSTCPYSQHVKNSWVYSVDERFYSYLG
ncbi:hypothetical protein DVB69_11495 [Sporosarcina sp. BI001-red]|uniref:hypothetical protein n=1 Tax=Sporosarcina sp. BI001-red TaxID=2282866 RepID=UPI000E26D02C|nr:hypothetical protein [Sporosarcina sp. BI001-red]REB07443.1 hypothetical protein DVB69_11495 [Sporosarcina sp. BI001-red]